MNVLEQVKEALEDVLSGSVDATTYPDGPCLDSDTRADCRKALAALAGTP